MSTERRALAYQHVCATNDRNGNPRRLWVVYDTNGNIMECHDEGYSGSACIKKYRGLLPELANMNVTPSEYSALKRNFC